MPLLSPLLPTSTPTQDTCTHTAYTLLPNLTTLQNPPHRVIILAPSRPPIDASITSYPAYSHAWTTSAHSHSLPLIYTSYVIILPLDYAISSSGTHVSPGRPRLSSSYDDDDNASLPTPLPATPTRTRLLSTPTTSSQAFLFPMTPLSPPAYSNADSGHVHAYRRDSAP
ncbi:hypothetical protein EDD85DRAFT_958607 [Armillaria nabsnona]|nr:hypothetical protein EDD85DRAFT_958607 [Armillaria nabsnona]